MDDKPIILIASVLKPINDVRAYHKIGSSLAQTNKYDVNIIGFDSKKVFEDEKIKFHPIYSFKRNAISRLFAPVKFLKKLIELKPKVLIVTTPELLIVSFIFKIIFGYKLVYDIQENYRLNIKYSTNNGRLKKQFMYTYVCMVESLSKFFTDLYLLAEKTYANELIFFASKAHIIVENKVIIPRSFSESLSGRNQEKLLNINDNLKFIISGTIGYSYGTLEGIRFFKKLKKQYSNYTLTIIGYSADYQYLNQIKSEVNQSEGIQLIAGDSPLPYEQILEELKDADFALMPYKVMKNLAYRIPTKFYECIALQLPIIISHNQHWKEFLKPFNASISIDFKNEDAFSFSNRLKNQSFFGQDFKADIYWEQEANKLIDSIESIV